jgi:hypothetical protein
MKESSSWKADGHSAGWKLIIITMLARPTYEFCHQSVESSQYFHSLFLHDSFILLLSIPDLPNGHFLHAFWSEFCMYFSHPHSAIVCSANLSWFGDLITNSIWWGVQIIKPAFCTFWNGRYSHIYMKRICISLVYGVTWSLHVYMF